ncbi:MAG: tetratricopeptide repeat protein [bacterium]
MGKKYFGKRQYLYLCFTFLIFFLLACATIKNARNKHTVYERLQHSQALLTKRDFKSALKENLDILSSSDGASYKDSVLFNTGLIYAHYDNPEKDYNESNRYFEKIIHEYPQSSLAEQSRIWTGVLKEISEKKIKNEEKTNDLKIEEPSIAEKHLDRGRELLALGDYKKALEENRKVLSLTDEKNILKDDALFNIGLIYAHYGNPEKDYKMSRMSFKDLIKDYPQSPLILQAKIWLGVLNVIEREKQVDIEIEKKKKELIR